MKSIRTLIRLRQHEMDAARRALSELEVVSNEIDARRQALDAEFSFESARAHGDAEASFVLGDYIAAVRMRRRQLDREKQALEPDIALAEAKVRDAFRELKRFELAETMQADRAAKVLESKEQDRLDEVALSSFRQNAEDQT